MYLFLRVQLLELFRYQLRMRLMNDNFSIASGAASATGTIIDNNNAPTGNDHSCFTEG
jgi:hypothetical protein